MSAPADAKSLLKRLDVISPARLPGHITGLMPISESWQAAPGTRPAAVVMLFIPPEDRGGDAQLVLTRRSTTVRSHRGQIGFAGGRADADDRSPTDTALRELHEELGVPPDVVTVAGLLPPTISPDGSQIVPVVAAAPIELSALRPAESEVESVFAAPWTSFTPAQDRVFRFNIFGHWRTSHLFELPGRAVWGLTALIIANARLGSV